MKEKKYVVVGRGVQKFTNGDKVPSGGFVPDDISEEEIEDKLNRGLIVEFDEELTAAVQASKSEEVNLVKDLKARIKALQTENGNLIKENEDLKKEINSLLEEPKKGGNK